MDYWYKKMVKKIDIDIQKKLPKIKNLVKEVVEIEKKDNIYPDLLDTVSLNDAYITTL